MHRNGIEENVAIRKDVLFGKWFLHKIFLKNVTRGVHRNDDKKVKLKS